MPLQQLQSTVPNGVSGTSVTAAFNSACTPGSTIVVAASCAVANVTFTFSDPTNGTYYTVQHSTGGSLSLSTAVFTNQQASSALTITATSTSSTSLHIIISEWSGGVIAGGVDQTAPIFFPVDTSNIALGTSSSPSAGGMGTLAQQGELVIVIGTTGNTSETWTAGSGYTIDPALTGIARVLMLEYQVMGATTVGPTANFTLSGSSAWVVSGMALRPAANRTVFAITNPTSTFTAPADWPGTADRVDLVGGGAAGRSANGATDEGLGGGGGAYTYIYNYAIPNGQTLQVGAGGSAVSGSAAQSTWIVSNVSPNPFAEGGHAVSAGATGGGGLAINCRPAANASSGGNGGAFLASTTCGPTGGGGAAGPFGPGGNGGAQNATGATGGTGGGGGGSPAANAGVAQTASNGNGTAGGLSGGPGSTIAGTGGTAGATPTGSGGSGASPNGVSQSGGGGGGGASDGAGSGGSGGNGGNGAEWYQIPGIFQYGSGGGGGANGGITSGSTPPPGPGGLYGGGGAGGGAKGTFNQFGAGANGLIIVTYTPLVNPTVIPPGGGIFVIP